MTNYVILNAALDSTTWTGRLVGFLYSTAAFFGNSKLRSAPIIDIFDKREFAALTPEQQAAITNADKILVLGHSNHKPLLFSNANHVIDPYYLANFFSQALANAGNKRKKISIVACESLELGRSLIQLCSMLPYSNEAIITARGQHVIPNPFTGKKFNLVKTGFFSFRPQQAPYKIRYSINGENGNVIEQPLQKRS